MRTGRVSVSTAGKTTLGRNLVIPIIALRLAGTAVGEAAEEAVTTAKRMHLQH